MAHLLNFSQPETFDFSGLFCLPTPKFAELLPVQLLLVDNSQGRAIRMVHRTAPCSVSALHRDLWYGWLRFGIVPLRKCWHMLTQADTIMLDTIILSTSTSLVSRQPSRGWWSGGAAERRSARWILIRLIIRLEGLDLLRLLWRHASSCWTCGHAWLILTLLATRAVCWHVTSWSRCRCFEKLKKCKVSWSFLATHLPLFD